MNSSIVLYVGVSYSSVLTGIVNEELIRQGILAGSDKCYRAQECKVDVTFTPSDRVDHRDVIYSTNYQETKPSLRDMRRFNNHSIEAVLLKEFGEEFTIVHDDVNTRTAAA